MNRRAAIRKLGLTTIGGVCVPAWMQAATPDADALAFVHPHIFWRKKKSGNLRTIDDVVRAVAKPGLSREIWKRIEAACDRELGMPPLTCRSGIPGRRDSARKQNNPDYTICRAVNLRLLRHAIALSITGNPAYKTSAMEQLEALFDDSVWPDWIDQAHLHFELPADLRTGMLSQSTSLAFDWLYPFLDYKERAFVVEGIDRRGIQPYLESMKMDPWWSHDLNNWYTVIIGGLGIAGMALGGDHPQAGRLVEISLPGMREYLSIYGEDGSFNESVAYSNATRIPVAYFYAYYYHRSGGKNPVARHPFPQTAEWTIYATLPPGRFAAFGDGWVDAPVQVEFMTAIASATRNRVFQSFAKRHLGSNPNPYELLWLDGEINGVSPAGKLPLGKAFPENSALIFSRTSWDSARPGMIVYGKAKRAQNHEHNDLGQLCIDIDGKRMITDPGSPSSYPPDFFEDDRYQYYNASVRGHNVLMFGDREQRYPPMNRGVKGKVDLSPYNGRFLRTEFDEEKGGLWQLDLANAYSGVKRVRRSVIHLFPGWVAVLDEAELEQVEGISLRWHTAHAAYPDKNGNFHVANGASGLACRLASLGQPGDFGLERHAYEAPYNLDRSGTPLEQRNEPYVEWTAASDSCRLLTLFALDNSYSNINWERSGERWAWRDDGGECLVVCTKGFLEVLDVPSGRSLRVQL